MIDWIYMLSMLGIGVALMLGIGTRVAAMGGVIWMVIFFTAASLWPENNPLIDDHIIEAVVLVGIAYVGAGRFLGLGNWWRKTQIVKKYPVLE